MYEEMGQAYRTKANHVIKHLEKRRMKGIYCQTQKEARALILKLIPPKSSVSWGDSMTLEETGIKDMLREGDFTVFDREKEKYLPDRIATMRQGMLADYFLMSSNAITLDGELVNIDGRGNRCAALCFGPENIIVVIGMNKIAADIRSAIQKIRTESCPPNAIRHEMGTPCGITGKCTECLHENCMCGQILVTRYSRVINRITVIIIGEVLGY